VCASPGLSVCYSRLQKGCRPDHVPLGKQILSAEPYSMCPTAQVKRTLLRTFMFPASLVAWTGVPGSPQASAELPAAGENQRGSRVKETPRTPSAHLPDAGVHSEGKSRRMFPPAEGGGPRSGYKTRHAPGHESSFTRRLWL